MLDAGALPELPDPFGLRSSSLTDRVVDSIECYEVPGPQARTVHRRCLLVTKPFAYPLQGDKIDCTQPLGSASAEPRLPAESQQLSGLVRFLVSRSATARDVVDAIIRIREKNGYRPKSRQQI